MKTILLASLMGLSLNVNAEPQDKVRDMAYILTPNGNISYQCDIVSSRVSVYSHGVYHAKNCDILHVDYNTYPLAPNTILIEPVRMERHDSVLQYMNCSLIYSGVDPEDTPYEKSFTVIDCRQYLPKGK